MRSPWLGALAFVLIAAGMAGIIWTESSRSPADPNRSGGPSGRTGTLSGEGASLGARIYLDGIGEDGLTVQRTAVGPGMMGGGCVTCHGIDGKGGYFGMMGGFEAPDIRYSTLTSPHDEHQEGPWSDSDIKRAITDGTEPDGRKLDSFMPRWDLTTGELAAVLDYLKELDNR